MACWKQKLNRGKWSRSRERQRRTAWSCRTLPQTSEGQRLQSENRSCVYESRWIQSRPWTRTWSPLWDQVAGHLQPVALWRRRQTPWEGGEPGDNDGDGDDLEIENYHQSSLHNLFSPLPSRRCWGSEAQTCARRCRGEATQVGRCSSKPPKISVSTLVLESFEQNRIFKPSSVKAVPGPLI